MYRYRIIPVLLMDKKGSLIKTVQFKQTIYVGDPINAVKIFNEKEVDELILLDIRASVEKRPPYFEYIKEFAGECFMPICYGGGVKNLHEIERLIYSGIEKIAINSVLFENKKFLRNAVQEFGSSTIVASIDIRKSLLNKQTVYIYNGKKNTGKDPFSFAKELEEFGAGEIILNSISRDGTMTGYDIDLISQVSQSVAIPVIACGGAGKLSDFSDAVNAGASAVAAGSFFIFHGKHKAVLINYPEPDEIEKINERK